MAIEVETELENKSGLKQRIRRIGRSLKSVDLRAQIVANPFAAVGIAVGVGALAGLARPMPQRNRVSGALVGVLTAIGFRAVRTYALGQLGTMAKNVLLNRREGVDADVAARSDVGTGVRYTPAH
jgi:hypothetical protein